jgi:hemoglobin/transferrin/lactoferrin receptor protein
MRTLSLFRRAPLGVFGLLLMTGVSAQAADQDEEKARPKVLEQTVVVGGRIEQELGDIAGSVSVMSTEEIRTQAVSNMSDLFRYEPGVEISGSAGSAQNFTIRGMGSDRVLMIKDGMRMNEGYGANGANDVVGRGFIDVDTIKQVEVAKGASSSLFGADALGGVVAFTTKDPVDYLGDEDFHLNLNTGYDQRSDEGSVGFTTAFAMGKFSAMINAKTRSGNETQNFDDNRPPVDVDTDSILFKTVFDINSNNKLSFSVDYYSQDVERPSVGDLGDYLNLGGWTINSSVRLEEKENTSYTLGYTSASETLLFDNLDIKLYQNDTEQTNQTLLNHDTPPPFGPGGSRDNIKTDLFEQSTVGISASLFKEITVGKVVNGISYGFDYDVTETNRPKNETRIQNGVETRNDDSAPFPKNDTSRAGIYVKDQIELGAWQIIPGLRYDYYSMEPEANDPNYENIAIDGVVIEDISDSHVSANLGVIYQINEYVSVFGQYAEGFKVPPYDLAYFTFDHVPFGGNAVRIIPSTDLEPEESESFEIGVRGEIDKFNYSASTYYNTYENFISIENIGTVMEPGPFGPVTYDVFQYQNLDEVTIKGVEIKVGYYFNESWSMFANANWMDGKDDTTGDYLSTVSPFSGTLGATYAADKFSANIVSSFASHMSKFNDGERTTAGYGVVDLMMDYRFTDKITLNVSVFNVLDREYTKYSSVAGAPDDDRDFGLLTEPARSVSARFDYAF